MDFHKNKIIIHHTAVAYDPKRTINDVKKQLQDTEAMRICAVFSLQLMKRGSGFCLILYPGIHQKSIHGSLKVRKRSRMNIPDAISGQTGG